MSGLLAGDIHSRIGREWPAVLAQLGINESFLRLKKAGPCPVCAGRDRFTFDNRKGHGDFICRACGPGDGFELLQRVHGWDFRTARREVMRAAGIRDADRGEARTAPLRACNPLPPPVAKPTARVLNIARTACAVVDCPDACAYLESRKLWPLPAGCTLKAHVGVDYFHEGQLIGRYPALVAEVRDIADELVTVHVTYLHNGRKLEGRVPRKLLTVVTGREGCAVRLFGSNQLCSAQGPALGIAEGIETALSATVIDGIPVWAALNTSLLAKFEPPPSVKALALYADRDVPGLLAAGQLLERLQGRIRVSLKVPQAGFNDFNDQLTGRRSGKDESHE
jgi:putative DNA primase/helicase